MIVFAFDFAIPAKTVDVEALKKITEKNTMQWAYDRVASCGLKTVGGPKFRGSDAPLPLPTTPLNVFH